MDVSPNVWSHLPNQRRRQAGALTRGPMEFMGPTFAASKGLDDGRMTRCYITTDSTPKNNKPV
jgi:hypothetical protein